MLLVNDGNNGKKDHEQRREGQRFLKRMSNIVFIGDAIKGRQQDNDS